jgi:5-methylcytosine-specific restriction endonuclease McrA
MMTALAIKQTSSLTRPVLVLNKMWAPHRIDTVKDALGLLTGEYKAGEPKARIIDPFDNFATYSWDEWSGLAPRNNEPAIVGVQRLFRVPEVVLLTHYDQMPQNRVKFSRRMIHRRDNYTCQYCGKHQMSENLTIDHIVPRSQGGQTTWLNCVVACHKCNARKDNRTPKQASMKLIREPFKPKFELLKCRRPLPSWRTWINDFDKLVSECYWEVPLENDEVD